MMYKLYLYKTSVYRGDAPGINYINYALGKKSKKDWIDVDQLIENRNYASVIEDLDDTIPCNKKGKPKYRCYILNTGKFKKDYLMLTTSYELAGEIINDIRYIARKNALTLYDPQLNRVDFQSEPKYENTLAVKKRAKECIASLQKHMKMYSVILLEECPSVYRAQISYAITIVKDLQKSFSRRTEEFWNILNSLILPNERLYCSDECFHISGEHYTVTFAFEGYKKCADRMGYMNNGVPCEKKIHRMSCLKAKQTISSLGYLDNNELVLKSMRMEDLVYAYPNPADRYVAICNLHKCLRKYDHEITIDPFHNYGGDIRMYKHPVDGYTDDLTCSYLKIDEMYAKLIIQCVEKFYPYFKERYYDHANYLPDAMCIDILAEAKRVRKMLAENPCGDESRKYLQEAGCEHYLVNGDTFWKCIKYLEIFIKWLDLQIECAEERSEEFMINMTGP